MPLFFPRTANLIPTLKRPNIALEVRDCVAEMSDPVSLVGTAVGVVSFGIQLFEGLYEYFSAVQGRTRELDTTSCQIKHLITIFQALEAMIPKLDRISSQDAGTLRRLEKCIDDAQAALALVEAFLQSQGSATITLSLKDNLKKSVYVITFPIRLKELKKLQEHIKVLVGTVQLAVQIIDMCVLTRRSR